LFLSLFLSEEYSLRLLALFGDDEKECFSRV
jgi:hypothetical protein